MFENKSFSEDVLNHPLNAQAYALDILEERLGGKYRVSDPNSPFCFLLEYGASLNKLAIDRSEIALNSVYPKRAAVMEDLYRHMSDYDYVNMFSKPSTITIDLILNKSKLQLNAKDENEYYKRVDIPRHTVFTIGNIKFGMHYPITIRFVKNTNSVLTTYNLDEDNPLSKLTTNMVESTTTDGAKSVYTVPHSEETFSGLALLILRIPVYQFSSSIWEEDLVSTLGFHKRYKYNDKFYALRVFDKTSGVRTELSQSLSPSIYDYTDPTAYVKLDHERSEFTVTIPHVYFHHGQLGNRLDLELYTTLGELDLNLANVPTSAYLVDFGLKLPNVSEYSYSLYQPVTLGIRLPQAKTLGGSDGYNFEELRSRVINNNFYQSVPISPTDVEKYFSDSGFRVLKSLDGITDRVYTCYRELTDSKGITLPSTVARVYLTRDLIDDISTIYQNDNDTVTVLPTTLYRYDPVSQQCMPLTDSEVLQFRTLSKEELVETFNTETYTYSPYHLHLQMYSQFPTATTYDFRTPSIEQFLFLKENTNVPSMMTAYAFNILLLSVTGDGGYRVYFTVNKSNDLYTLPEEKTKIYIHTRTTDGENPGIYAKFHSVKEKFHIYYFDIATNYAISRSKQLSITNFYTGIPRSHYIDLTQTFYVTYLVDKTIYERDIDQGPYDTISFLPDTLLSTHVALSRQEVTIQLGKDISDVINNDINIAYTDQVYLRHEVDVPLTYDREIYATDDTGNLVVNMVDSKPQLTVLHRVGDTVYDTDGATIFKHKVGDMIYDSNGRPILLKDRTVIYDYNQMFLDAKIYLSEHPDEVNFLKNLPTQLYSYISTVRSIQSSLLERTHLYFNPIRTLGIATYGIGNDVTRTDRLDLSFHIKYYVTYTVITTPSIQDNISKMTYTILESALSNKILSITEIFESIRLQLTDYIVKVDVLGINGQVDLQTLIVLEEDTRPSIAKVLKIAQDNTLMLVPAIDIEYVAISS